MGQFYPFIIVPMDYELCLEVKEYINEICVSDIQKKKNKKNRIITEILYYREKFCNYKTSKRSEELTYIDWFAKWKNTVSFRLYKVAFFTEYIQIAIYII